MRSETEKTFKKLVIPLNKNLPNIDKTNIRVVQDIAIRANIFGIFIAICDDPNSISFFNDLITKQNIFNHLFESEKKILKRLKITKKEQIEKSWYQEGLYVLCWVLGVIDKMELPKKEAKLSALYEFLPPEKEFSEFVNNATMIKPDLIYDEADFYYCLNWAMNHPEVWSIFNKFKYHTYNSSVVLERRKVLDWVLNDNSNWDEI